MRQAPPDWVALAATVSGRVGAQRRGGGEEGKGEAFHAPIMGQGAARRGHKGVRAMSALRDCDMNSRRQSRTRVVATARISGPAPSSQTSPARAK